MPAALEFMTPSWAENGSFGDGKWQQYEPFVRSESGQGMRLLTFSDGRILAFGVVPTIGGSPSEIVTGKESKGTKARYRASPGLLMPASLQLGRNVGRCTNQALLKPSGSGTRPRARNA